jgi:hypothetical protein
MAVLETDLKNEFPAAVISATINLWAGGCKK